MTVPRSKLSVCPDVWVIVLLAVILISTRLLVVKSSVNILSNFLSIVKTFFESRISQHGNAATRSGLEARPYRRWDEDAYHVHGFS